MKSEQLRLRLIGHRAKAFASVLQGVAETEVVTVSEERLSNLRELTFSHFGIHSKPLFTWRYPVDSESILSWLCERLTQLSVFDLLLPFESPYAIHCRIVDIRSFITSYWSARKTLDLLLYSENPDMIIEVQDTEEFVGYFELLIPSVH